MPHLMMSSSTASRATFRELAQACAAAGAPAIALLIDHYKRFAASGESDADMVAAMRDNGVRVVDIEPVFGVLLPDPSRRTATHAERLFRLAQGLGAENVLALSGFEGDVAQAAKRLADFCDRAAARGLNVVLEPVPALGLLDLPTAWSIAQRADRPNVGLVLDTWHFFRGAGSTDQIRSLPARAIRRIQLSDGPLQPVRGLDYLTETRSCRLLPGEGEFDLVGLVRVVREVAERVEWNVEVCSASLGQLPGSVAARRAADATREILAEAGVS
jgi:sugar phosphate isomerase/epimerase